MCCCLFGKCEINEYTYQIIVFWQLDHVLIPTADTKSQEARHLHQSQAYITDQTNGASTLSVAQLAERHTSTDVLYIDTQTNILCLLLVWLKFVIFVAERVN